MDIREINRQEIHKVLRLIDQYDRPAAPWPSEQQLNDIFCLLKQSGGCILGVEVDGDIVATCTINICANLSWSGRSYAMIENVIVEKTYRHQGIGKALLQAAKQYAQDKNCYKVALLTGTTEQAAVAFYQSVGFEASKIGFQIRFNA